MSTEDFITEVSQFDDSNILFSLPKEGMNGSKRIYINIKDGQRKSKLFIPMGRGFSYGVEAATELNNKDKITGYQMVIPMHDMEGPTSEQTEFLDAFNRIVEKCVDHLLQPDVKKALKKFSLSRGQLENISPLWQPRTPEGEPDMTKGPRLYGKLFTELDNSKRIVITTFFKDTDGYEIEPMTLLKANFRFSLCVLQFHSIFVGTVIKLQVRVHEVEVEPKRTKRVPLMLKKRPVIVEEEEDDQDPEEPKEEQEPDELKEEEEPKEENASEVPLPKFEDESTHTPKKVRRRL